jgi:hypothetical protein
LKETVEKLDETKKKLMNCEMERDNLKPEQVFLDNFSSKRVPEKESFDYISKFNNILENNLGKNADESSQEAPF